MAKIQWYPGHMHKAAREMRAALAGVDVVVELLDARLPFSSANPLLAELRRNKPVVRVLTRSDLADPERTDLWIRWYRETSDGNPLALSARRPAEVRRITGLLRAGIPQRPEPVVAMVAGIPNVGKSTLINLLAGRSVARTGNEPAITQQQQRVAVGDNVVLLDTPGVLWPNVENAHSGFRLAATGAIRATAMPHVEVAGYLARFLATHYPGPMASRYGLGPVPDGGADVLEALGRSRGCLGRGGVVDSDRAARMLLNDFRAGRLGGITLETPEMIAGELREVEREREEKAARKASRKRGNPAAEDV